MIRTQNKVPDYYVEKSRDFQVLCRILDFLLNSTKYNSESILRLTDTERAKDTVLPLIGDKFGIYDKDAYSMREMLDALPCALKYKGSLHAVLTLVNAFLDSMDIFDYATVYVAKNKASADEISSILNRKVLPYSIIIILSSYPNLTKLKILDTYLKMVIPTGVHLEYAFGYSKRLLDKYIHRDFVLLYYTNEVKINALDEGLHQLVSTVLGTSDVLTDFKFIKTEDEEPKKGKDYYISDNIGEYKKVTVDEHFTPGIDYYEVSYKNVKVLPKRHINTNVFDELPEKIKTFMEEKSKENVYLTNAVGISSAESMQKNTIKDEYWKKNVVGLGLVGYMVIDDNAPSEG